jgi:hypothetical protein
MTKIKLGMLNPQPLPPYIKAPNNSRPGRRFQMLWNRRPDSGMRVPAGGLAEG